MSTPGPQDAVKGLTGRHVLMALIAFFGIVFGANFYLVRIALATHSGVVANEPYKVGLRYNDRIAAEERQEKLGWQHDIKVSTDGHRLEVRLTDKGGAPVSGVAMTAVVGRPATTQGERQLMLKEGAPGVYGGETGLAEPGSYIADVEVRTGGAAGDVVYRARTRLWIKS